SGAALVEQDQTREVAEPKEEATHPGRATVLLPLHVEVSRHAERHDEIARTGAHDLVRDVHVAALRVFCFGERAPSLANVTGAGKPCVDRRCETCSQPLSRT